MASTPDISGICSGVVQAVLADQKGHVRHSAAYVVLDDHLHAHVPLG